MNESGLKDTICALATPPGTGAIAVVRLSGPEALIICGRVFHPKKKKLLLTETASHSIHFGTIGRGDELLDEVLVSVYRAPHSYTGEEAVEISCHGSVFIQQKIVELLILEGARLAKPGEFTLRAFLNGKFDLAQAEAVADLISASSKSSHDLALDQMRGGFSSRIKKLREALVDFASLIELELDFSEEDVEFADRNKLTGLLEELSEELKRLIQSFQAGNVIKNGIPVAIIGRPNVGKSTLLNALLNEERAIVSEIPGTTRDTIEDTITIENYQFRFIDTAGLRHSTDQIETAGIERTLQKIDQASIVLYVFDINSSSFDQIRNELEQLNSFRRDHLDGQKAEDSAETDGKKFILIANKTDILGESPDGLKDFLNMDCLFISAKRKENIGLILERLIGSVKEMEITDLSLVSNIRHLDALKASHAAVEDVMNALESGISTDLVTVDIRRSLYHLGEITGEITNDEILGNIFSKFCIGK